MKKIFKFAFLIAMTTLIVITGCKKEKETDDKTENVFIMDGQEFLIADCIMRTTSTNNNILVFTSPIKDNGYERYVIEHMTITMTSDELVSKTYQEDEITEVWVNNGNLATRMVNDFKMIVKKSSKIYDISITGKFLNQLTHETSNFSLTYKGTVEKEK